MSLTLPDAAEIAAVVEAFKRVVQQEIPGLSNDDLPPLVGGLTGAHYACVDRYQPRADGKMWIELLEEFSRRVKTATSMEDITRKED